MAVIRVQKTENYTVMSNHHLRNKELSLKAKGLISLMLSLPPDWDYSVAGLVSICKESHTSVRSALKELEEQRYLIRKRKNSEKGYFVYEYTLYEVPEPHTEKQHAAKEHAENTQTENRSQLSKEEITTNKLNIDKLNKEKDKEKIDSILQEVGNADLIELYKDYIDVRKGMDAPLTPRALQMLIARCERLSKNNIKVQKLLLENAIINGWKNVFLPKESELENVSEEIKNEFKDYIGL